MGTQFYLNCHKTKLLELRFYNIAKKNFAHVQLFLKQDPLSNGLARKINDQFLWIFLIFPVNSFRNLIR